MPSLRDERRSELALYHDQRYTFTRHLDRVGVPQLVRREPPPYTSCSGSPAQVGSRGGARPRSPARGAVDHAEERPDRQLQTQLEPCLQLLPAPGVHADLAAPTALAATDEQGATAPIEIALGKGERFLDAQASSPQHHDQPA